MDIESKTSIYEEKEETQEVNPEEQKSEIKSERKRPGTSDCSDRCGCYSGDWRDYGGAQAQ